MVIYLILAVIGGGEVERFLRIFYNFKLYYLINHVKPSKKVNRKIVDIHIKLNKLEKTTRMR